ncbi:MAG: efflux RND transporter periplasmic adaptor subunit [Candidatus Solibacter usitatus]|nr:efflux RND transporter periplasmic adaptor subunit [Candidatus Solibacter usitatus]
MSVWPNPEPLFDPLPPPPSLARRRAWHWLVALALLAAAGSIAWSARQSQLAARQKAQAHATRAVRIERGTLEIRMRLNGQTSARSYSDIAVPKLRMPEPDRPLTLLTLAASGSIVRKGDLVAEFDPQSAKDHYDDTVDGLNNQENQLAKRQSIAALDIIALLQKMEKARARMDKAKLDLQTIPVRSGIRQELLKLAASQAEVEYLAMAEDLPQVLESEEAAMRMAEIGVELERLHVQRHKQDLERLTVRSPTDGMVVLKTLHRHGVSEQSTYQAGDRVYPGSLMMRVVDRRNMQVEGAVNQAESGRFRLGQEATVRLDGYPEAVYKARVHSIGAMAAPPGRQQFYIRSIPIRLEILNPDERLLPDLSASADVLVERHDDVLLAPAEAVRDENGQSFVYVQKGETVEKRHVSRGRVHGAQAEILEGVEAGEIVVID